MSVSHRWITVRDRSRTKCPYIASTMPRRAGEETHENGIGMPPPPAVGAKVQHDYYYYDYYHGWVFS